VHSFSGLYISNSIKEYARTSISSSQFDAGESLLVNQILLFDYPVRHVNVRRTLESAFE
jgi:hypothetical protein